MKRARETNEEFAMPLRLFKYLVFPYLTAVDGARLGATCRALYNLTRSEKRFRLRLMRYSHPSSVPYGTDLQLAIGNDWAYQGMEQLRDWGYVAEGSVLCYEPSTYSFVLINDFYARGFESDFWEEEFIPKVRQDTEFHFTWKLMEFPTLPNNQRYTVIKSIATVHRGSCIRVSWPARFY